MNVDPFTIRGARHGLTMKGKLARVEAADRDFLAKYGKAAQTSAPTKRTAAPVSPTSPLESKADSSLGPPAAKRRKTSGFASVPPPAEPEAVDTGATSKRKEKKSKKNKKNKKATGAEEDNSETSSLGERAAFAPVAGADTTPMTRGHDADTADAGAEEVLPPTSPKKAKKEKKSPKKAKKEKKSPKKAKKEKKSKKGAREKS